MYAHRGVEASVHYEDENVRSELFIYVCCEGGVFFLE